MKKILFVDDEKRVTDGLRDLLRRYRRKWKMSFANSGEEALEALTAGDFDVIVSDARMPVMDGIALLIEVKQRYPGVVRIMLSGQTEMSAGLRAISVAHQFLNKPCEPAVLETTIDRVCELQDLVANEPVKRLVGAVHELPPQPKLYTALTQAMGDENVPLEALGNLLKQDLTMSAKLLQLVNSSFFRRRDPVHDVGQAVVLLGLDTLRNLVLAAEVFNPQVKFPPDSTFDIGCAQRHALSTAAVAAEMVESKADKEIAYMGGMLHDIGNLVLALEFSSELAEATRSSQTQRRPLREVEFELLGTGHAEIGAYLLGLWGLPHPILEAVAYHADPMRGESPCWGPLPAVHLANHLVESVEARGGDTFIETLSPEFLQTFEGAMSLSEWRDFAVTEVQRVTLSS